MTIRNALTLSAALAGASLLSAASAQASDCFILVHGHSNDVVDPATGLDYWSSSLLPTRTITAPTRFIDDLTGGTEHYAIVNWDSSTASALPYWHPDTAGDVAAQLKAITHGDADGEKNGVDIDGVDEGSQECDATDDFYIVAHSQGAQVMTYISGNASPSDDLYNSTYDTDVDEWWDVGDSPQYVEAPFDEALENVNEIYTLGGAINGTEGMDEACDGGWDAILIELLAGEGCIPSMQTHDDFNPSEYTSYDLTVSLQGLGGYKALPFPFAASSLTLDGEDDGIINLASQMNCEGSPQRDLEQDFTERKWWGGIKFRCDEAHKRHSNSYNVASVRTDHDAERNGFFASPAHEDDAEDIDGCGDGETMAATVAACL